ncbi:MAG: hypothetical protein WBB46_09350 [Candidatus Deferrimicrobiaceae bacterium]
MRYMRYELICSPKPEKRSFLEFWLLGALLLFYVLFTAPGYQQATDDYQEDPYVTSWLSKKKASQLLRYHGANAIKITEDQVYIKREGLWICVYRDPFSLPEKVDQQGTSTATVRVDRDKI